MRLGLGQDLAILGACSDEFHAVTVADLEYVHLRIEGIEVSSSTILIALAQLVRTHPILVVSIPWRRQDHYPVIGTSPQPGCSILLAR